MRKTLISFSLCILLIALLWWPVKSYLSERYGISEINVVTNLILQRFGLKESPLDEKHHLRFGDLVSPDSAPAEINIKTPFVPFKQIGDSLGERALTNTTFGVPGGGAIFDANGDGMLDIYIPHSGRPRAKATNEQHVLLEERVPATPSTLFINQGNNESGNPRFKSIQDILAEGNKQYVREELLIENKYIPRTALSENENTPGRIGVGAVAADFNGDGKTDLYVLNYHYGFPGQTQELSLKVYPARRNIGRESRTRREAIKLRAPSFLWDKMVDGKDITVDYGGGPEREGRNSLYINLGDSDGDGVPEWKDVTDAAGVGGRWATASVAVSDIDRDGDLDLYVGNFIDADFLGLSAQRFGGNRNQLYVNQLADTGGLYFINKAEEYRVAGLHDDEGLAANIWSPHEKRFIPTSEHFVNGKQVGEKADHTWAVLFADYNQDNWPDLIVANDLSNRLRVYENLQGRGFKYLEQFNHHKWDGCWMGMDSGDLDGDLKEEIFVTSCGGQMLSVRNTALLVEEEEDEEMNITARAAMNFLKGYGTIHHGLLSYNHQSGFKEIAKEVDVNHSRYIPPDIANINNFVAGYEDIFKMNRFATSLTAYEFAWNVAMFDVDNDSDLDLYLAGSLLRGNDNLLGDLTGNPGRLLVNESTSGHFMFTDRTLEYRLLDITDMDYEHNPPRRQAPGTRWHKRDYIYITDLDAYSGNGLDPSRKSKARDIFRMHEAAHGMLHADLNADGFEDLVVVHAGGYNSVSPRARNLRVKIAGRRLAVPAPNKIAKPPTNYEPGKTFVYINGGAPHHQEGHWVKIRLVDDDSYNRTGIGARFLINNTILRYARVGGYAFGAATTDLHVGLGASRLRSVGIVWPSGDMNVQNVTFDPGVRDQLVCIDRQLGVVDCHERFAKQTIERYAN